MAAPPFHFVETRAKSFDQVHHGITLGYPVSVLVATLAFAAALFASQSGDPKLLHGELHDGRGAVLAGVVVEFRSGASLLKVTTAPDGRFTMPEPPAGEYSIAASREGATARSARATHLPLEGETLALEWQADGTLLVRTPAAEQTGTGGEHLSSKAVSELPLNKRDFSQLLLLAAGTMTDTNGAANFTQQFAVNGQRGTAAVFAMDGADSSDPEMGGATFSNFNVDAVQEIRSSSGWMPAEIGRGAAGFTDIITRSGTNAIHGSVFEFLRNAALDARNFFDRRQLRESGPHPAVRPQ